MAANGLRLGVVADFNHKCSYEAHTSNIAKMYLRSTSPAITPNRCYVLPFFCRDCPLAWWVSLVALLDFLALVGVLKKIQMCHQMRWQLCV
jgi:hypothetical protein